MRDLVTYNEQVKVELFGRVDDLGRHASRYDDPDPVASSSRNGDVGIIDLDSNFDLMLRQEEILEIRRRVAREVRASDDRQGVGDAD